MWLYSKERKREREREGDKNRSMLGGWGQGNEKDQKVTPPDKGLEPLTLRLKVWCSTDWANRATPSFFISYLYLLRGKKYFMTESYTAVIFKSFGVVLFSVFLAVNRFTEIKKTPKWDKYKWDEKLSDHDSIQGHRNLNETERSVIARYRSFNAPKICKITVFSKPLNQ